VKKRESRTILSLGKEGGKDPSLRPILTRGGGERDPMDLPERYYRRYPRRKKEIGEAAGNTLFSIQSGIRRKEKKEHATQLHICSTKIKDLYVHLGG